MKRRYVSRLARRMAPPALPKDEWKGWTFIEAGRYEFEVIASGKMPSADWPHGSGCSLDHAPLSDHWIWGNKA